MAVSQTHSRPGLAMTFDELNEAKMLILDLLGYGLEPENLVEAGISKECLVPCLRELKIRLPANLDISDVVLFDPPEDEEVHLRGRGSSFAMAVDFPARTRRLDEESSTPRAPSLPPGLDDPQNGHRGIPGLMEEPERVETFALSTSLQPNRTVERGQPGQPIEDTKEDGMDAYAASDPGEADALENDASASNLDAATPPKKRISAVKRGGARKKA